MVEPLKDNFWKKLSEIGVEQCTRPEERRYVSQLNIMSVIAAIFCLVLFIPSLLLPPAGYEYLTAALCVGGCLLFLGTLYFQARSQFLKARLYFISSSYVLTGTLALILGRTSLQHLYFLTIGVGSFYVFPPNQRRFIALACISSILAIVGVEAYFSVSSYQGLLDQDQAIIAR